MIYSIGARPTGLANNLKLIKMGYYCKECNEEFDRPIETDNIETDRCPCCGSTKIKEY